MCGRACWRSQQQQPLPAADPSSVCHHFLDTCADANQFLTITAAGVAVVCCRVRPAEFITTAQAILLLLVLVVQLITLYDNMAIRRLLAAAGPLGALDAGAGI